MPSDERIEARLLNMHAIHDVAPLYPLRLWNGEMPGQEFPANLGALRALTGEQSSSSLKAVGGSLTYNIAPQLRGLLRTYELDIPDGRAARLERFARFIGAYELLNL